MAHVSKQMGSLQYPLRPTLSGVHAMKPNKCLRGIMLAALAAAFVGCNSSPPEPSEITAPPPESPRDQAVVLDATRSFGVSAVTAQGTLQFKGPSAERLPVDAERL